MGQAFPSRTHWRFFYLIRFGVLVLCTCAPAEGVQFKPTYNPAPVPEAQQPPKNPVLRMWVDEGLISATIADAPLQKVLEDLAARTGVIFEVRSHVNPLVSVRLNRVSIQEAVQRLAPDSNAIFLYSGDPKEPDRVVLIRLFPRAETFPQPSVLYLGTGTVTKGNDMAETPEQAMKVLADNPNVEARLKALEIVADGGGDAAVQALVKAVSDPAPQVRVAAIEALAAREARAALPVVLKRLKDPNPAVRRSAVTAVALLGSDRNIKDLKPLSSDPDTGVAAAAETAVRKLASGIGR